MKLGFFRHFCANNYRERVGADGEVKFLELDGKQTPTAVYTAFMERPGRNVKNPGPKLNV